ncbi:TIGR02450 family Trp-rich protein [Methylophilus sp. 3sh_L]|uniref:TIGR02450 family Trp-rich protein n=1 Tax=Methylophilus sp. 3sh_L TaxID=3377114 RepID=UPI00398EBC75
MNKEKHFMVTKLIVSGEKMGDEETQVIEAVELEAVMTGRVQVLDWHALQNREVWKQGWVA